MSHYFLLIFFNTVNKENILSLARENDIYQNKPSGENLQTLTDLECRFKLERNSTQHFPSGSTLTFQIYEGTNKF